MKEKPWAVEEEVMARAGLMERLSVKMVWLSVDVVLQTRRPAPRSATVHPVEMPFGVL